MQQFQDGLQILPDWPQMGQIWDFLRSVSVHFGSLSQNVLKLILKSHRFVPIGANLTYLNAIFDIPVTDSPRKLTPTTVPGHLGCHHYTHLHVLVLQHTTDDKRTRAGMINSNEYVLL